MRLQVQSYRSAQGGTDALRRAAWDGRLDSLGVPFARTLDRIRPPPDLLEPQARAELSRTLEQRLGALGPHVHVLEAARGLLRAECSVVVTGQQPGLLGGPLLCLYKAMHAVRLARSLAQAWERPVVALFWNHADDHDVAEVHHAWIPGDNLELTRVALAGVASGRTPISQLVLDPERHRLGAIEQTLAQALLREPHGRRALELFLPRAGESLARSLTRLLLELFGPLGLMVVEPDWIRPCIGRALLRLVRADPAPALRIGVQALSALGLTAAVDPETAPYLYRLDARGPSLARVPLRLGGAGFRFDGEETGRSAAELAAQIVAEPAAWSPSALSRALVQDLIFPVAAYVGGWGELAYHVQLGELRRAAGVNSTPFVARASITLLEQEVQDLLAKLGLDARALAAGEAPTAGSANAEPAALQRLRLAGTRAAELLLAERGALAEIDPALAANLVRTADQVRGLVDKLADKGQRVHDNQLGTGQRAQRRAVNALFPRGEPQERVLGGVSFVARHGLEWIDQLFDQLPAIAPDPLLATFSERRA